MIFATEQLEGMGLEEKKRTGRSESERLVPEVLLSDLLAGKETIEINNYQMFGVNLTGVPESLRDEVLIQLCGVKMLAMPRGEDYLVGLHFGEQEEFISAMYEQLVEIEIFLAEHDVAIQDAMMVSVGEIPDVPLVYRNISNHAAQVPIVDRAAVGGALGAKLFEEARTENWCSDGDLPLYLINQTAAEESHVVQIKGQTRYVELVKPEMVDSFSGLAKSRATDSPVDPEALSAIEFCSYVPLGKLGKLEEGSNRVLLGSRVIEQLDVEIGARNLLTAVDLAGMSGLVAQLDKYRENPDQYQKLQVGLTHMLDEYQVDYSDSMVGFMVNEYGGDGGLGLSEFTEEMLEDAEFVKHLITQLFEVEGSFLTVVEKARNGDLGAEAKSFMAVYDADEDTELPRVKVGLGLGEVRLDVIIGKESGFVKLHADVGAVLLDDGLEAIKRWIEEGRQALGNTLGSKTLSPEDPDDYQIIYITSDFFEKISYLPMAWLSEQAISIEQYSDRELGEDLYFMTKKRKMVSP